MEKGYTINHYGNTDSLGDGLHTVCYQYNYNALKEYGFTYYQKEMPNVVNENTVAKFTIKPKTK